MRSKMTRLIGCILLGLISMVWAVSHTWDLWLNHGWRFAFAGYAFLVFSAGWFAIILVIQEYRNSKKALPLQGSSRPFTEPGYRQRRDGQNVCINPLGTDTCGFTLEDTRAKSTESIGGNGNLAIG